MDYQRFIALDEMRTRNPNFVRGAAKWNRRKSRDFLKGFYSYEPSTKFSRCAAARKSRRQPIEF